MIGERLKKAREALDITQKTLALEVGLSSSIISQYEKGYKSPRLDTFLRIADFLQVSPEYILGRDVSVTSDNTNYLIYLAKKDLEILSKIKEYDTLYKMLSSDRMDDIIAKWARKF